MRVVRKSKVCKIIYHIAIAILQTRSIKDDFPIPDYFGLQIVFK